VSYFQAQLSRKKKRNDASIKVRKQGESATHIELEAAVERSCSARAGSGGQTNGFLCSGIAISPLAPFCRTPRAWQS
jgi:hypothetical protein